MENSFAKYIIANVFKDENEWMDVGLRENFLEETFRGKDISTFGSDLIEIVRKVPEKLYYCIRTMVANTTCPPSVLEFVTKENFTKIKGKNFILNFCEGGTYKVGGIALIEIIKNANDELLEKIFFEIEKMPFSCLGKKQKNGLLRFIVSRDKTISPNLLKRLLRVEDREVSAKAEERLEEMNIRIEFKADELAFYKSLDLGVLCKMNTYGKGYSRVEIKEMTPGAENILGTALKEEIRVKEVILDLKTVFVKEEGDFSFFTITSSKKGVFVKQQTHRHPLCSGPDYLSVVDIDRKSIERSIWASGPAAGGSIEIV